ncbi:MAG: DUF4440 domain-containing protein [Chloroflexi bacterium]|nr:DUF4440 domain-containing protein [Chloroflexota bacterium]MCH2524297.1 DUF4440 domain-containing protein [Dehalococcoidia bacterium]
MTDPRNFLDEWIQLVNNGDIESLLNLYDNEAILIPTFSNGILNTPEKLRGYFEELGSREELSVSVNEKYLVVQELQNQIFALGGIYDWRFNVEGEVQNFEARFSYLVDLSKPSPILHHHSSQVPRTL